MVINGDLIMVIIMNFTSKSPGATAALKASLTKLMKRVTEASARVEKAWNGSDGLWLKPWFFTDGISNTAIMGIMLYR
jgi:hypothetical protein